MKKILQSLFAAALIVVTLAAALPVGALPYKTYTYSISGQQLTSPDAYTPVTQVDSAYMGLDVALNSPKDLVCGPDERFYIADSGNNRIVVCNSFWKVEFTISTFTNEQGIADGLASPNGVYITEKYIYVADTDNNRLVLFDLDGNFVRTIEQPESDIFEKDTIYKPVALAVDKSGGIYVVSATTYQGIIALNADGDFQGFIGAQQVTASALQLLWRSFQTAEQRKQSVSLISTEFNNIAMDYSGDGFMYVTTSSIDEGSQQAAITSKAGTYAPVKKLNTSGTDIMRRNGFFGPGGEVTVNYSSILSNITGPSKIVDVAVGPEGTWSIIDQKRSKVYTYDEDGNLLFAFGDQGLQLGNIQTVGAIAYHGSDILLLDTNTNKITTYSRTEYGDILINALANQNQQNYDASITDWQAILQRNSNFDAAYIGIGKALYRQFDWQGAMEYFKDAYDVSNYSNAYKMYRKEVVTKYIILVPICIVVICFLLVKFFGFAKKVNARATLSGKKKTFWEEVLYAFHLIVHPFDGFWDLKHEKRGSVRAAIFYIALAIITFTYQAIGRGYIFNPRATYSSIFTQITSLLVPLFLWVTANWCLTTLFDGEGSFKDIFIATSYCLVPIPMIIIPTVIASNFVTASEATLVNGIAGIAWWWVGILLFFGMMVTHDYSLLKNVLTCIGTVVGMAFIMFIGILFSTLLVKMVGFVSNIITEISYRM